MADQPQSETEDVDVTLPSGEVITATVPKGMSDQDIHSRLQQQMPNEFSRGFLPALKQSASDIAKGELQSWKTGGSMAGTEQIPQGQGLNTFNPFDPIKTAGYLVPQPIKDIAHRVMGGDVSGAVGEAIPQAAVNIPAAIGGLHAAGMDTPTMTAPVRGAVRTVNRLQPKLGGMAGAAISEMIPGISGHGRLISPFLGYYAGKEILGGKLPGENLGLGENPVTLPSGRTIPGPGPNVRRVGDVDLGGMNADVEARRQTARANYQPPAPGTPYTVPEVPKTFDTWLAEKRAEPESLTSPESLIAKPNPRIRAGVPSMPEAPPSVQPGRPSLFGSQTAAEDLERHALEARREWFAANNPSIPKNRSIQDIRGQAPTFGSRFASPVREIPPEEDLLSPWGGRFRRR